MAILKRKDAWKLSATSTWEPTLLWYAKAVGEMSKRPATDPTSWRFQAGIHGYSKSTDPLVSAGAVPSKAVQDKFWRQCQHGSWFFLPWHRMYLGFFEQIVRAAVVKLGGPADWTLPYWNYSDSTNPDARKLPPAFREGKLPDGSPNPLLALRGVKILRAPGINAGSDEPIPEDDVDLSGCLGETFFSPDTDTTAGDLGFGGPATGFNHDGQTFGQNSVESLPHNAIHVDVGGEWVQKGKKIRGWMINPDTAALDPIFWLHHCNIDRLWAVWNGSSNTNSDPSGSVNVAGKNISWQTSVKFGFNNATGSVVSMTPAQVMTTIAAPFAYDYDDTTNPMALLVKRAAASAVAAPARRGVTRRQPQPEMLGASGKKLKLTGTAQTAEFAIAAPTGPAGARRGVTAEAPQAERSYLQIENVVSRKSHTTYKIYVNLPNNPTAADYEDHYAGVMHLFGVMQASTRSAQHAGNGLHFSLDITDMVNRLRAKGAWDDSNVRVTFVPRGAGGAVRRSVQEHEPIQVGRISLYRA
jgi:tyrosinase